jgi:hypothetical protein
MRWLGRAVLLLMLAGAALPCCAAFKFRDGNELYDDCFSKDAGRHGLCVGYVMAVVDVAGVDAQSDGSGSFLYGPHRWCMPIASLPGVARDAPERVTDIVAAYLRDNPDRRFLAADVAVAEALARAWPCRP